MALEVGQGNKHIGIHDSPADLGRLHIFAALHRYLYLVVALQAVGDEDLTAGGHVIEAVEHGAVQMIQRVFPSAHIQGVAVGQEGLTAPLLYKVRHRLGPVGPQIGQVARLTEMQLDGHKLLVEINITHPRRFHQARQLLLQILMIIGTQIGKINLRCHNFYCPFSVF